MTQKSKKDNTGDDFRNTSLDNASAYLYTFDLGAAASLVTAGSKLVSLDRHNPRKVQFIFQRKPGIDGIVEDYWSDRLNVRARTFFDNVKMLKNRIYSE